MNDPMNEKDMRDSLKPAYQEAHAENVPPFNSVWANAEAAYGQSRNHFRAIGGVAAAIAVLGVIASLYLPQPAELGDDYLIADALMNSTTWSAPSDSLMPVHQFDIYQEISFPGVSTNEQEGTLL